MSSQMLLRNVGLMLFNVCVVLTASALAIDAGILFKGRAGPGQGKRVVLVAGDDEYHSEEELPQFAKILAQRHGFTCTVLFSINRRDGTIAPHERRNIPGLEALQDSDLLILFTRFRDLPDEQMKHVVDYVQSGRPIIGIRTATHAFAIESSPTYARYSFDTRIPGWEGGFGRRILGETWVAHHGLHGKQSTRGIIPRSEQNNPILRGIKSGEIWVPTDVYEVRLPLPRTCHVLMRGQVLANMSPSDAPAGGEINDPMMPVAWTNIYTGVQGNRGRVFTTTMGSADDFENEALRRLLVNAVYWALGMDHKIPENTDVTLVGKYHPHSFLSSEYTRGLKPADLAK